MQVLTQDEQKVYKCIVDNIKERGYAPSVRDIGREVGINSTATIFSIINSLCEKSYIIKDPGKSRSLRLPGAQGIAVPLLGRVAAGAPVLAEENIEEYITINLTGYNADELFALRITGESMIEAGIYDGDIIIVRTAYTAEDGQIVVAVIDDMESEATVKRFFRHGKKFRLQPENSTMEPIIVDNVTIAGHVVGLIRHYEYK